MALIPPSPIYTVNGISPEEEQRIRDFLQGSVYCWCKNRANEWFALRDLMGGTNYFWRGTPLIALWNKHKIAGLSNDDAVEAAAKDGGWLLKRVIDDDRRTFETNKEALVRMYRWTGNDGLVEGDEVVPERG